MCDCEKDHPGDRCGSSRCECHPNLERVNRLTDADSNQKYMSIQFNSISEEKRDRLWVYVESLGIDFNVYVTQPLLEFPEVER